MVALSLSLSHNEQRWAREDGPRAREPEPPETTRPLILPSEENRFSTGGAGIIDGERGAVPPTRPSRVSWRLCAMAKGRHACLVRRVIVQTQYLHVRLCGASLDFESRRIGRL
jgi:hypothetical protein